MGSSMMELSSVFPVRKAEIGLLLKAQPFLGFTSRVTRVCVRAAKGESGPKKSSSSFNKPATRRKRSPWNDVVEEPNGTNGRKPTNKSSRRRSSSPRRSSRKSRLESTTEGFPTLAADDPRVLVSAVMPVAIEKILQAGEPAATPSWQTFTSSLSGVWRGVGAAFSPSTAEMEAIALGSQDEMLYDSRILSTVEECKGTDMSEIHRKTVWAVGNPFGEQGKAKFQVQDLFPLPEDFTDDGKNGDTLRGKNNGDLDFELIKDSMGGNGNLLTIEELKLRITNNGDIDFKLIEDVDRSEDGNLFTIEDSGIQSEDESSRAKTSDLESPNLIYDSGILSEDESSQAKTSDLESPNLIYDAVMEEDVLDLEPGLVFFEDGSYSRGPVTVLDGDLSNESSVFKIEQCLVKGGHTRIRLVHTIEVAGGGESVQLLRVAVYNEEWMGPCHMKSISDSGGHHLKLFSQHTRLQPQALVGTWNVFEISAMAVVGDDMETGQSLNQRPTYVYMTTETQKRRLSPELPVRFIDEDIMDLQDVTVMWLPGGISAYVDVKEDGTLTVGIGWYDDGVNLVMERDYNTDGRLSEVRNKSEVKGGWVGGRM